MPDVQGTFNLLIEAISHNLLTRMQTGAISHLVVADKNPAIYRLPTLPGVQALEEVNSEPVLGSPRRVRDSWHRDQFYGFIYVVRGEVDLLLCRKVLTCRTGDFVFLMPHTWRNHGNASHWERPDIQQADSELLWLFFGQDGVTIHFCKSRAVEHARSPVLFIPDSNFITLLEFFGKEVLTPPISGAVTQLLWIIFERTLRKLQEKRAVPSQVMESPAHDGSEKSIGEKAQHYIEANLSEKLTLAIVARAVHVSRTKLAQDFFAYSGENFGAYLLRRRIERAQHLLMTTALPISHISWMSGFSDPDYLSAVFRNHLGTTPTAYRNSER